MLAPTATLIRWLGPWSKGVPEVARDERMIGPMRAALYKPSRAPLAVWVLSPGLHWRGPDEPRMDRAARVLAAAGFFVLAPYVRDHCEIRAGATAAADLMLAFEEAEAIASRERLPPPSVFAVSFGSGPAIALCGDPRFAERVGGLWMFGGFADFRRECRFAALGEWEEHRLPFDPTNVAGVFLNLAEYLDAGDAASALAGAWRRMCERTWNRDELKRVDALRPIAQQIAAELPAAQRDLFLQGCGLAPGTRERLIDALARATPFDAFCDPRPHLARLRAPVVIAHGRTDQVVCYHEAAQLRAMLPAGHPHRYFITDMFTHGTAKLPSPRAAAKELQTLWGVVHSMATLPLGGLRRL